MTERVKISEIYPIQTRESNDPAVVAEYAEAMEAGTEFPPISVVHDGKRYWMWDGHHRLAAARQTGMQDIPCEVSKGSEADARWLACSANQAHGLRRTNADKRRAVTLALELHPEFSDERIATHVGVSREYVLRVRHEVTSQDVIKSQPDGLELTRIGKDGKSYPVKPAPPAEESGPVAPDGLVDELAAWLKKGHLEASEAGILAREHEAVQIAAYDYLAAHPKVSACQALDQVRRQMEKAGVLPEDKNDEPATDTGVPQQEEPPAKTALARRPGRAMEHASEAINEMRKIKKNDSSRHEAFMFVKKWVTDNE